MLTPKQMETMIYFQMHLGLRRLKGRDFPKGLRNQKGLKTPKVIDSYFQKLMVTEIYSPKQKDLMTY